MASLFSDESANDAFNANIKTDECSTSATTTTFGEDSYDSGISCDSSFSSSSGNSSVKTGPTNFERILCSNASPELPAEYWDDLDKHEKSAAEFLNSSPDFAESYGRRSPLMDIASSSQISQSSITAESPISRKCFGNETKNCRKRSLRSTTNHEMFENPIKRFRPQLHRAFSASDATTTKYSLKVVNRIRSNDIAFGRIDSKYLADLINTMGEKFYEKYILIDCRYPFEFDGGHIKGAINLYDPGLLRSTFYPSNELNLSKIHSKKPIFYCEFSSVRGPNMANALRELDRRLNHENYPHVDYNEIYVLSEGYRHFYENGNAEIHCEPPSYIPMTSKKHVKELKKYPFHKKSRCSLRSRSTQTLVRSYSANLSTCFCRTLKCSCPNSLPSFPSKSFPGF